MPHQSELALSDIQHPILIYQTDDNIVVDVLLEDESVWLNQEQIALLFGKARSTIAGHIQNIFDDGELDEKVVCRDFRHTTKHWAIRDKTQNTKTKYYNLDMILAVGYRVKSKQGIQFRTWATTRLKEYLTQWFTLNESKLKSGKSTEYFDKLQSRLREIRLSERLFYQKIKDIYTTSSDYDPQDEQTVMFFKIVQNKLLRAISEQTAAELVYHRVDAEMPLLGMQSYDKTSSRNITKKDISVAKNYLNEEEIKTLWLLVEQYLAFAETMAQAQIPMTMSDWIQRLDSILQLNQKNILTHAGKISHELATQKAEIEYQKFKQHHKTIERKDSIKQLIQDINHLSSQN